MIIVIGSKEEAHSEYIHNLLLSKGEKAAYLDTRKIPNDFITSWYTTDKNTKGSIYLDNLKVNFEEIKSVYWRWHYGITIHPDSNSKEELFKASMLEREFVCYLDSIFKNIDCLWVNSLNAINMHKTKAHQLHLMAKNGIRVPKTLITNDKEELKSFVENYKGDLIFKPVRGGAHTEKFDLQYLHDEKINNLKYCPVTFQEKLEGVDVRVYVVGDKIFAAEIRTTEIDFRNDPNAEIVPVDITEHVKNDCFKIMEMFDLNFTGIDIRHNPETDEYVFIEANPSPMFIHFEKKTGFPVSETLAEMLIRGKNET